jgi:hypothetical protein
MKMNEPVASGEAELAWAFPSVDPRCEASGRQNLGSVTANQKEDNQRGNHFG